MLTLRGAQSRQSAGFTLIELLVAASLTVVIFATSVTGLVNILGNNQKTATFTERRVNLNRALSYIADEIRMSSNVTSVAGVSTGTLALHLRMASDNTERVYYIDASPTNWQTPRTVFRTVGGTATGGQLMIDAIYDPGAAPACTGTLTGERGFYACIGANQRTVTLTIHGKTNNPTSPSYVITTQAFARS